MNLGIRLVLKQKIKTIPSHVHPESQNHSRSILKNGICSCKVYFHEIKCPMPINPLHVLSNVQFDHGVKAINNLSFECKQTALMVEGCLAVPDFIIFSGKFVKIILVATFAIKGPGLASVSSSSTDC